MQRSMRVATLAAPTTAMVVDAASAQPYPARAVKSVVPLAAGFEP